MKGRKPVYQSEKLNIVLPRLYVARIRDEEAGKGISGYIREALEEVWDLRPRRNKSLSKEISDLIERYSCVKDGKND